MKQNSLPESCTLINILIYTGIQVHILNHCRLQHGRVKNIFTNYISYNNMIISVAAVNNLFYQQHILISSYSCSIVVKRIRSRS